MIPRPPGLRSPEGHELQQALEPLFERMHDLLAGSLAGLDPVEAALLSAAFAEHVQPLREAGVPVAARLLALLPPLLDPGLPAEALPRAAMQRLAEAIDTGLLREAAGDPPASIWPALAEDALLRELLARAGQALPSPAEWWCPPESADWQALPTPAAARPLKLDATTLQAFETAVLDGLRPGGARAAAAPQRLQALCAGLAAAAPEAAVGSWRMAAAAIEAERCGLLAPEALPPRLPSRLLSQLRAALRGQGDTAPVPALPPALAIELGWACVSAADPLGDEAPELQALRRAAGWLPWHPAFRPLPTIRSVADWLPAEALDLPALAPQDAADGDAWPDDTLPMPLAEAPAFAPAVAPAPSAWAEVDLGFDPEPEAPAESDEALDEALLKPLPRAAALPPPAFGSALPELSLDLSDPLPEAQAEPPVPPAVAEPLPVAPTADAPPPEAPQDAPPEALDDAPNHAPPAAPAEAPNDALPQAPDEAPPQAPDDAEAHRQIGPLRLPIVRFNQFLHEADESSRRLNMALAEWAHAGCGAPGEEALLAARQLADESAALGLDELAGLAAQLLALGRQLASLPADRAGPRAEALGTPALLVEAGEQLRHLLHQFAAGFLRHPPAEMRERLDRHLAELQAPLPPELPAAEAGPSAEAGAVSAVEVRQDWIDWPTWAARAGTPQPAAPALGAAPAHGPLLALAAPFDGVAAATQALAAAQRQLAGLLAGPGSVLDPALRQPIQAALQASQRALHAQAGAIERLEQALDTARRMPFAEWAEALRAPVEAAAQALGKPMRFSIDGGSDRVDPQALARWQAWVQRLLLQALETGLEAPLVRAAAGKPPVGTVLLSWSRRGAHEAELMVGDDGAGLPDPALDALADPIRALGLSLHVETLRGAGRRMTLRGPCSLPTGPWLGLRLAGGLRLALPADRMSAAQDAVPAAWRLLASGCPLMWQGRRLPALGLGEVVPADRLTLPDRPQMLAVQAPVGEGLLALEVAPVAVQALQQPLPAGLSRWPEALGLGRDAEGGLWLRLDPAALRRLDQPPPA